MTRGPRAPLPVAVALALLSAATATAQTRVAPHPLPRPAIELQPPRQAPAQSAPEATDGLRSTFGTERALRLLRSGDADDVVRGIRRLATIATPEALAALLRAATSSPIAGGDGVTGSARHDPRALLEVVRALAGWVDREPARRALRDVLEAPQQQLDTGASAAADGDGAELRAPRVALARQQAAMALASSGSAPALEMLVESARKGPPGEAPATLALAAHPPESPVVLGGVTLTTRSTISLAAQLGDLRALDALLGVVKASDPGLRAAAIAALGEVGDARILPAARAALHDTDAKVRASAGGALVRLGVADAPAAVEALVGDDATALEGLRLAADVQGEGVTRAAAARAAAASDPALRAAALAALGRQASEVAISALTQLGRDPRVQGDAAAAIAHSPSAAALPALEAMAVAPGEARRAARAYFVRRLVRGERSVRLDALLANLAAAPDGTDRALGVEALVALGERPLERALGDPDPRVRRAAAMGAPARTGEHTSAALLARLAVETDPPTRIVLALGLAGGDDREAVPGSLLLDRARSGGPDAPLAALALARRAEGPVGEDVKALLASADHVLRAHVARGLGASMAADAAGVLAAAYEFEADAPVRRAIVGALAARTRDAGSRARSDALELAARLDPNPVARSTAASALRGEAAARRTGVPEVAWVNLVPAEGAAVPPDATGALVDSEGLARPILVRPGGLCPGAGGTPGRMPAAACAQAASVFCWRHPMNRHTAQPSQDSSPAAPAREGPSFEAAIKRLTDIVQALERGDLPLEDSLRLFEEGVALSRASQQRLDAAEKRVEQLLAVDDQGRPRTAPFETDASDDEDDR